VNVYSARFTYHQHTPRKFLGVIPIGTKCETFEETLSIRAKGKDEAKAEAWRQFDQQHPGLRDGNSVVLNLAFVTRTS
jgi:hypothetical protein